ncbi:MAG TPA: ABC transporter permease [Bryobacteraceae bacterium]
MFDSFRQDICYAVRMLHHQPGFTLACVVTLALGIGANTAIFSIVNAALLTPIAVPHPNRVVMVWTDKDGRSSGGFPASGPDFQDWRASGIFENLAGFTTDGYNLLMDGTPRRVQGAAVTESWFEILREKPYLGRLFRAADMQPGHDHVAVLGYGLWRTRFGGDREIAGKTAIINSAAYTIIGVLPPHIAKAANEKLYVPLLFEPPLGTNRALRYIGTVGRLAPHLSLDAAQSGMSAVSQRLAREYPNSDGGYRAHLQPMEQAYVQNVHTLVLVLFGAVGFVLLIACANIASLLLVRGAARTKEIAVRAALGASKARILRQLITESVLLALAGAAVGIVPAWFAIQLLARFRPESLPNADLIGLNPTVLLFTALLAVCTGVLFGGLPAWMASRRSGDSPLRERSQISGRELRFGNFFVIAEVAFTVVLLAGAGLMLRTIVQLRAANPGYETATLTMRISLAGKQYAAPEKQVFFCKELLRRISNLPGVQAAGAIDSLPTSDDLEGGTLHFTDRPQPKQADAPIVVIGSATPDYFRAMHIPLIRGRFFTAGDNSAKPLVVILDQKTARKYWPDTDPLGRTVRLRLHAPPRRIVGIVGNIDRNMAVKLKSRAGEVYVPFAQSPVQNISIAITSSRKEALLVPVLRRTISALAPDQPVYQVETMAEAREATRGDSRFSAWLLGLFALLSLVLAAVGIYAVIAYTVERRRREIGIRMALGATPSEMLLDVLRTGAILIGAGTAVGIAGALALTRLMRGMLYGVGANDPLSFVAAALILAAVGLAAAGIPAYRASRIDPARALRQE